MDVKGVTHCRCPAGTDDKATVAAFKPFNRDIGEARFEISA